VAVIDTGIDYEHPDLAPNYMGGINIINSRKSPKDDNGHIPGSNHQNDTVYLPGIHSSPGYIGIHVF